MVDAVRLAPDHVPALRDFLARLPEGERRWFREDVLDPAVVEAWAAYGHGIHLMDLDARGCVLVYGAVLPGRGWSSHVGELTLMVAEDRRREGLGTAMGRRLLVEALRARLRKVVVEVVADQASAIAMFGLLGFEPEALLRDHVRDREGQLRDLMILAHPVAENWAVMAATGVEDALA